MGGIVVVVIIIVIIVIVKKNTKERQIKELMISTVYFNTVNPLESALEKEGFRLSHEAPSKET